MHWRKKAQLARRERALRRAKLHSAIIWLRDQTSTCRFCGRLFKTEALKLKHLFRVHLPP